MTFTVEKADTIDVRIYTVEHVPCLLPCRWDTADDNYLRKKAGLFPDVLQLIGPMKFNQYPTTDEGILGIRQRINNALERCIRGENV